MAHEILVERLLRSTVLSFPWMRTLKEAMVEEIIDGFFGVYDGQGGSKAAEYVVKNMHSNVFDLCITTRGNLISERLKRLHKITIQVILRFIIIR
uniref:Putative PPM-type phosphatase domain-containing protein n=1 Tax=Helianthus annuus TaxID=4232 RepID=A0A251UNX3_HELAN